MKVKTLWWVTVLLMVCPVFGQGLPEMAAPSWAVQPLAGEDMVSLRLLRDGGGRTRVGPEVTWLDGVEGDRQAWCFGFAGLYHLVDQAPLTIGSWEVPATWYVGVRGGVLVPEGGDPDATIALMTGLTLGSDEALAIGVEVQYALTERFWSPLGDVGDDTRVVGHASWRFR